MFIRKSSLDEIANSMTNLLVDGVINKQAEVQSRIVKAADYLNAAAEIFDESGLTKQAEVITAVLESLAGRKKKKKPDKKAPTSEKMVENLKQKGWVFDESSASDKNHADTNCAMCGSDNSQARDKSKPDMDFEDELDFDDFDSRIDIDDSKYSPHWNKSTLPSEDDAEYESEPNSDFLNEIKRDRGFD